eukprot:TRINITY_DN11442_c0_g1_i1.p1 TRINITY_DN11442_c0_g1~~TRINITY_DN11442_c0_g1_i1.p1  ORF type:complete len:395 (-),score=69.83 TRINITY_DN11442_c0_g1_i1:6-1190(-)
MPVLRALLDFEANGLALPRGGARPDGVQAISRLRPSPGSMNGCRVAVASRNDVYISSGSTVTRMTLPSCEAQGEGAYEACPTPTWLSDVHTAPMPPGLHHTSEIQNITYCSETDRLASIDSKGCAILSPVLNGGPSVPLAPSAPSLEQGWCGVALNRADRNSSATAQFFEKKVAVYDADKIVREWTTVNNPTQIIFANIPNATSPLVCTTEFNQLVVYDIRAQECCAARVTPSAGWLYALNSGDGLVGVGGAQRTLTVHDPRTWRAVNSWQHCLKQDMVSIHFSKSNKKLCFVGGVDSEIVCGDWACKGANSLEALRVDSRWLGIGADASSDMLVGLTAAGSLYVLSDATCLFTRAAGAEAPPSKTRGDGHGGGGGDDDTKMDTAFPPKKQKSK